MKCLTLLFNTRIHNVNDSAYLQQFFVQAKALKPLKPLSALPSQTVTDLNLVHFYFKQLLAFQRFVPSDNASLSLAYVDLLLECSNEAKDVNPAFPYEQCKQHKNALHVVATTIESFINDAFPEQPQYFLTSPMQFGIHSTKAVMCIKRDLLLQSLSVYYKDVFFSNEAFVKMKQLYSIAVLKPSLADTASRSYLTVYDEKNVNLSYPATIRNYSSAKWFTPKVFFKHDLNFFRSGNFAITHSYCKPCSEYYTKRNKPLLTHSIDVNADNALLFYDNVAIGGNCDGERKCKFECDLIGYKVYFGSVVFASRYFMFASSSTPPSAFDNEAHLFTSEQPEYELSKRKQLVVLYTDIAEIVQRRFLYMNQALEVFLKNGKSYFFNFLTCSLCEQVVALFRLIKDTSTASASSRSFNPPKPITFVLITDPKKHFNDSDFKSHWEQERIDTFQYLLLINKYASRSYNDLNQYPIVPWSFTLLHIGNDGKFKNSSEEATQEAYPCKRLTECPISMQLKEKQSLLSDMYATSLQEGSKYGCHFRLHYSTSSYVIFYLARLSPYTALQIKLQAGKFDSPNRQFNSVRSLLEILFDNFDNRELVPELLTTCEYFYNANCVAFGRRSSDRLLVNNIMLPHGFRSPCEFVVALRWTLNTLLKQDIHKWIDIVFGEKQFVEKSRKEGVFLYPKSTYAQKVNLLAKVEKYRAKAYEHCDIVSKVMETKVKVLCFGQTPMKLFDSAHARWEKMENNEEKKEDEFSEVERLASGGIKYTFKVDKSHQVLFFNFTSTKENVYIVKKTYPSADNDCRGKARSAFEIELPSTGSSKKQHSTIIPIQKMQFFKHCVTSSHSCNDTNNSNSFTNTPLLNKNFTFILSPSYAMFDLFNGQFFVTGRNNNNQIVVYQSHTANPKDPSNARGYIYRAITTPSFVSVVYQIAEETFVSGHLNGRLLEWRISVTHRQKKKKKKDKGADVDLQFTVTRDVLAHDNAMITAVAYNNMHNILLTCAFDGNIHIRKYHDFELINVITADRGTDVFNYVHVSNYDLIYATFMDKKGANGSYMACYTLNGVKVANLIDTCAYSAASTSKSSSSVVKTPTARSQTTLDSSSVSEADSRTTSASSNQPLTAPVKKITASKKVIEDASIKTRKVHISVHGKAIVCTGNDRLYIFNGTNLSERTRYVPADRPVSESESSRKIMNFIYNEANNLMYCLYGDNEITRITNDGLQKELQQPLVHVHVEK